MKANEMRQHWRFICQDFINPTVLQSTSNDWIETPYDIWIYKAKFALIVNDSATNAYVPGFQEKFVMSYAGGTSIRVNDYAIPYQTKSPASGQPSVEDPYDIVVATLSNGQTSLELNYETSPLWVRSGIGTNHIGISRLFSLQTANAINATYFILYCDFEFLPRLI